MCVCTCACVCLFVCLCVCVFVLQDIDDDEDADLPGGGVWNCKISPTILSVPLSATRQSGLGQIWFTRHDFRQT